METNDTFRTIEISPEPALYKEKGSKFHGLAFPVSDEDQVKQALEAVRKEFPGAVHYCYAYRIGAENVQYRANDDGEPSNSAGMPILGQLQSFDVTNVLVVVVRYFGGVKLGVGGLISAYRTTAQMALEASEIVEKTIDFTYAIRFSYADMNKVMRIIREKSVRVSGQKMELDCEIIVSVRKKKAEDFASAFENLHTVFIEKKA